MDTLILLENDELHTKAIYKEDAAKTGGARLGDYRGRFRLADRQA